MFFTKSRRHDRNSQFEQMLKIIRFENVIDEIMIVLFRRYHEFDIQNLTNRNTILMFLKINVDRFNDLMLKRYCFDDFYEHRAINKKRKKKNVEKFHSFSTIQEKNQFF